ncbi:hypothetical protein HQN87_22635 [Paenibacillus tritici]|uniref:Uncharacterized protein n=1 Tax=Paenibacillus tritici TaxID=1873425 RepID=A0ABX2DXH4_9BACL|nr:hypothetical protein [Paenibacillus tritici]NQX48126.1 hypothetical protein [Paenibacillus tritici]
MQWEEVRKIYPNQYVKQQILESHTGNDDLKVEIRVFSRPRVARMNRILTDEQKKQMTSVIFKDEGVLSQLQQAQKDRRDGISTYSDSEEEFAQLLNKIQNE